MDANSYQVLIQYIRFERPESSTQQSASIFTTPQFRESLIDPSIFENLGQQRPTENRPQRQASFDSSQSDNNYGILRPAHNGQVIFTEYLPPFSHRYSERRPLLPVASASVTQDAGNESGPGTVAMWVLALIILLLLAGGVTATGMVLQAIWTALKGCVPSALSWVKGLFGVSWHLSSLRI